MAKALALEYVHRAAAQSLTEDVLLTGDVLRLATQHTKHLATGDAESLLTNGTPLR
jgi:hypothetical protein